MPEYMYKADINFHMLEDGLLKKVYFYVLNLRLFSIKLLN